MFTGIVTDIGKILQREQRGDLRARIGTSYDVDGIDIGASIACNGVCLTVIALGRDPQNWFDVEISAETVGATNVGGWSTGKRLNLERALKVGDDAAEQGRSLSHVVHCPSGGHPRRHGGGLASACNSRQHASLIKPQRICVILPK
jgi:riboflavin synthase alpha subunit